jgi:hypothetical protein
MYEIIRTTDISYNPERVSILTMTRGRPEKFLGLIESLGWTTQRPELTDVWCYLDGDDPTGQILIDHFAEHGSKISIHWVRGPRPIGLGQGYNAIAFEALKTSGLFLGFPDDYRIWSLGWDEMLRKAYGPEKDRLLLHYVPDPVAAPEQLTLFAGTREWVHTMGYLLPDWFPYWFGDTWIDDVSRLSKTKRCLPIKVEAFGGKGKTNRMWNLPFWWNFFDLTLIDRLEGVLRLLRAKGTEPELEAEILVKIKDFKIKKRQNNMDIINLLTMEQVYSAELKAPSPLYLEAEKRACLHLMDIYSRYPEVFANFPPEDFDLEAAFRADETPGNIDPQCLSAISGLFRGASLGSISARYGVGPGRLLELRNALFRDAWTSKP